MMPDTAMLLAAGLGIRMRPLTAHTAKPLLTLAGRTLLDHALDRLAASGVTRAVVNAHWHADGVAAHLAAREGPPRTILRREPLLLDTGGAVQAALADGLLGPDPFFVLNGDSFWMDGPVPALNRLAAVFDPAAMDAVLLVHRTFQVQAEVGFGDFLLDPWGGVRRRKEREVAPYVFAGIQLLSPALFGDGGERAARTGALSAGAFSMNPLWDRAMARGRLRAVVHDGLWFHLSTPEDLAQAERSLHERTTGETR